MAIVKPFKAYRPQSNLVEKIAELPYDVVSTDEAREIAKGNPYSFFHISKPEIDFPQGQDQYDDSVYRKGRQNFDNFIKDGFFKQDSKPCFYLYSLTMSTRTQTGLVACASVDDYLNGIIKKHELTLEAKEKDRTRHLDIINANTGPVYLFYKNSEDKQKAFDEAKKTVPEYDFTTQDGIRHVFRTIRDSSLISELTRLLIHDEFYIADGHHRAASAVRVCTDRRKNPSHNGNEEYNSFMAVIFPDNELKIMPYNRVVKDLNGMDFNTFCGKIKDRFELIKEEKSPLSRHTISIYENGNWHSIKPRFKISDNPVQGLDVKILQDEILAPILGIKDPRLDKRINFVGGIRGTEELEKLVDSGNFAIAFSMHPTSISELIAVSDAGEIMPPKSTWFEPKLRSGLAVHSLE